MFSFQMPDDKFGFGLVVRKDVHDDTAPMPSADLLIFYDYLSDDMVLSPEELDGNKLLIAPVWTNRMGWSRGYFVSVGRLQLAPPYVPTRMCFYDVGRKRYVDAFGRGPMPRREPCGVFGGVSYRWIDDQLSDAAGWPRVPVEEE